MTAASAAMDSVREIVTATGSAYGTGSASRSRLHQRLSDCSGLRRTTHPAGSEQKVGFSPGAVTGQGLDSFDAPDDQAAANLVGLAATGDRRECHFGKQRTRAELGDRDVEGADPGVEIAVAVAVAGVDSFFGSFAIAAPHTASAWAPSRAWTNVVGGSRIG